MKKKFNNWLDVSIIFIEISKLIKIQMTIVHPTAKSKS